ncbi:MAG: exodeoxyribonuclease III [Cyclobacteriaceae bacterium]|nr:exodeoxyribonuclease III [Cyclobacteriaceae bacterium]
MKVISWNVNGLRAMMKKGFVAAVDAMQADVLCLQETKAGEEEVQEVCKAIPAYQVFANASKAKKGYSGTAILCRQEPIAVTFDIGLEEHDLEGRVTTAEYRDFFIVSVYVPNSGEELVRLDYRERWNKAFQDYLLWLNRRKPVLACGDFNVAHEPIDLARPAENYNRSAGYTQREIEGFNALLEAGFTDTFRIQHPTEVKYSYWNYWQSAREKNIGWRIDYVLASNRLMPRVQNSFIYNEYEGSDHCPVGIQLHQ